MSDLPYLASFFPLLPFFAKVSVEKNTTYYFPFLSNFFLDDGAIQVRQQTSFNSFHSDRDIVESMKYQLNDFVLKEYVLTVARFPETAKIRKKLPKPDTNRHHIF